MQTINLKFTYQYVLKGNELSLIGDIEFARCPVRMFRMDVHFVDADGIILSSTRPISIKSRRSRHLPVSFDRKVPPNTRSMAFSYRGEIGDRNADFSQFWRAP